MESPSAREINEEIMSLGMEDYSQQQEAEGYMLPRLEMLEEAKGMGMIEPEAFCKRSSSKV